MATTRIADVVVPEIFTQRALVETAERSALLQSGAIARSAELDAALTGAGNTFTASFLNDLERLESNVSSDEEDDFYTGGNNNSRPRKITSGAEIQVRQSRNASWSDTDLANDLSGLDPLGAIAGRTGAYWAWDIQASVIATLKGVFADNDAAPVGTEHEQGDLSFDISGGGTGTYSAGTTDIGSDAFIDALATMGDAMGDITTIMMHSITRSRLQKQQQIETVRSADTNIMVERYLGRTLITSDYMPKNGGVYDTWLFGAGAIQMGLGSPRYPTEIERYPNAGNGGGQEVLFNRMDRIVHPTGHKWVGAAGPAGPSNAEQANAASWQRAYGERKQIRIARLVSREHG